MTIPKLLQILPLFIVTTLIFIVLKASALVTWSWWVVFSPLLLIFGMALAGLLTFVLTSWAFIGMITKMRRAKNEDND